MAIVHGSHQIRDSGLGFGWQALPRPTTSIAEVSDDAEILVCDRLNGISRLRKLTCLLAGGVDQWFRDEISQLTSLETLRLGTGADLDFRPLARLPNLPRLMIHHATKTTHLDWVALLKSLEAFGLEKSQACVAPRA